MDILKALPSDEDIKRQIMHTSAIIWRPNELTEKEIDRWLENFKGEILSVKEERAIALWLLNHFVYYNEHEVRYLCKLVYKDFIHFVLSGRKRRVKDVNLEIKKIFEDYKFHYLGKPSESGAYILYYFRQENFLPTEYFELTINKSRVRKGTVFIDDVTLSGGPKSQAYDFFNEILPKIKTPRILLTLIASQQAINNLNSLNVKVISPIIIDERNKCFSKNSEIFSHYKELTEKCKQMISHYGEKLYPKHPLGYKDCQGIFGFFYNTPDNTLPIFWSEKNGWYPIVKRYGKKINYHFIDEERFV